MSSAPAATALATAAGTSVVVKAISKQGAWASAREGCLPSCVISAREENDSVVEPVSSSP